MAKDKAAHPTSLSGPVYIKTCLKWTDEINQHKSRFSVDGLLATATLLRSYKMCE